MVQDRSEPDVEDDAPAWQRRVVGRSLDAAKQRSIARGARFVRAAATVLERNNGESLTVQQVADEAGQSLRTLYQYFASKDDLLLAVFEEAMQTYARLIRSSIAHLDDPVERLAGGIIGSARMPALHARAGVDRGLSRLRLQLGQAEPELVARAQEPVTAVFRELVDAAIAQTVSSPMGVEAATYFVSTVRTSFILSETLGSEYSVQMPDVIALSQFCLGGLTIERPRDWHEAIDARLELTTSDGAATLRRLAREPG